MYYIVETKKSLRGWTTTILLKVIELNSDADKHIKVTKYGEAVANYLGNRLNFLRVNRC
jgi:hypothetical protein